MQSKMRMGREIRELHCFSSSHQHSTLGSCSCANHFFLLPLPSFLYCPLHSQLVQRYSLCVWTIDDDAWDGFDPDLGGCPASSVSIQGCLQRLLATIYCNALVGFSHFESISLAKQFCCGCGARGLLSRRNSLEHRELLGKSGCSSFGDDDDLVHGWSCDHDSFADKSK